MLSCGLMRLHDGCMLCLWNVVGLKPGELSRTFIPAQFSHLCRDLREVILQVFCFVVAANGETVVWCRTCSDEMR